MNDQPANEQLSALIEQADTATENMAAMVANYYRSLVENRVPIWVALSLVLRFQASLLGQKAGDEP